MKNTQKDKQKEGFTLIEALVVLFIASIVIVTFLNVFSQGSSLLLESKKSLTATSLANEYIERVRNLAYDNIGVSGGIPNGPLNAEEVRNVGGTQYRVVTDIRYKDDDFDGLLGGTPNDTVNTDQKIITVTVYWGEESESQQSRLSTLAVPPGIETNSGAGTLSVNIIDSSGIGVGNASVRVVNVSEGIDFTTTTDASGNILLPGAPEAQQTYQVTATKNDYEVVTTYPPYPTSSFVPIDEHTSVLEGDITNKVMVVDSLSDIVLHSITPQGDAIPEAKFSLSGGRILGNDTSGDPVYNYNEDISTDTSGDFTVEEKSPGDYTIITRDDTQTNYEFVSVSPGSDTDPNSFSVEAGGERSFDVILVSPVSSMLWASIENDDDGSPLAGVSVRIENATLGIDEEILSDTYGNVFFPSSGELNAGDVYTLTTTLDGYEEVSQDVTISALTQVSLQLTSE